MGRQKMIHNEFYALGSEKLADLVVVDTGNKRSFSSMSMLLAAAIEVLKEFSMSVSEGNLTIEQIKVENEEHFPSSHSPSG